MVIKKVMLKKIGPKNLVVKKDRMTIWLSDKLTNLFETFYKFIKYLMAAFFICLIFLPASQQFLIQCCYNGAIIFSGFFFIGTVKNTQMVFENK